MTYLSFLVIVKYYILKNNDNLKVMNCDEYTNIKAALAKAYEKGARVAVIDDAGYIMTSKFMAGHRQAKGNSLPEPQHR